ncbi:hypothetical protein CFB39_25890 [Burkholderia sp. AU6039]|nr:hypothetical protein CFB39_25890 [Burkholderia sp. AU6039]
MSSAKSVPVSMSRYASRQSGATRARFCRSFTSAQRADNPPVTNRTSRRNASSSTVVSVVGA